MKKPLEILVNGLYKNEMKLLFGENFKIVIGHFVKQSKSHHFIVHAKLVLEDPIIITENYSGTLSSVNEDVCYYVNKSLKFMGATKEALVITTIDVN